MKKLNLFFILVGLVVSIPLFQSCLDDDNSNNTYLSMGLIKGLEDGHYYVKLDDGLSLYPADTTYVLGYHPVDSQRVFIQFRQLDITTEGYNETVQIINLENILTKSPITLTSANSDSIGDDPIGVERAWISAGYLNIRFNYLRGYNSSIMHLLNLVINPETVDDTTTDPSYLNLEFRQNANNDPQQIAAIGFVSFNLNPLKSKLENYAGIRLRYKSSETRTQYLTISHEFVPD